MFLLVSELLRSSPDAGVESWVGGHEASALYFSVIGEAELLYGVALLPSGRRKAVLELVVDAILREDFVDRILPFDRDAAGEYAKIAAASRSRGRSPGMADCQTAAIARTRGLIVVTCNIRGFEHLGVEVVNPRTAD